MSAGDTAVLTDDEAAVRDVATRIMAAWAANDADGFAAIFTEDGTLIGDSYMKGRDGIRAYMAAGFAGPYAGTRVHVEPLDVRFLTAEIALLVTRGSVLLEGESGIVPERGFLATSTVVRRDGRWHIAAYQNSKGTTDG
ncbi:SgcJ/EcaC family oxidoreductase [Micromonospora thermarum]|uniref:SgcJ/EcaC family oxidoreductase n=1 Tax=Micromonospora thermarum TaxID=2720024 RepID=A0ABX0Z6X9_9ACTN|nr:SgcJ/EcaC family oxidoreductase [Micromonospora thermarum]NJP33612.1 SgcJ/EcaC family oxidoreductase [Micromonospora thermarum]